MERRELLGGTAAWLALGSGIGWSALRQAGTRATSPEPVALNATTWAAARRWHSGRFGRIAYVDLGSGPGALFLHGLPLNGFQWRGVIPGLAGVRRCVAPDFLGLGVTEVAQGVSCAPATQVEMLAELLDALHLRSVDIVASDSGGAVAQLFLVQYPERVRSVVFTNCDVETDSPPPAVAEPIRLARAGTFADAWLLPSVRDKKLARAETGLGGATYTFRTNPTDEMVDMYFGPLVSSPEHKAWLHDYIAGLEPNPLAGIEAKLRRTRVPARILWGTGDDIFSPKSPDYLSGILPGSRGVRRVEGAKLFWPEEFPAIVVEEARGLWGIGRG